MTLLSPSQEDTLRDFCYYGDNNRVNVVVYQYQVLTFVTTLGIMPVLFCNTQLRRFYKPLAQIVDLTLLLHVIGPIVFLSQHPFPENHHSCAEILIGQFRTAFVMFGELHQVYFLSKILGVRNPHFDVCGKRIPLQTALVTITFFTLVIFCGSVFLYRQMFLIFRSLWTVLIALLQIKYIRLRRYSPADDGGSLISPNDTSVVLFEKLCVLQIPPAMFCFFRRLLATYFHVKFNYAKLEPVTYALDCFCTILFYLKALLIKENAAVQIEYV